MDPVFFYDYFSLRDVDVPRWHEKFFWPVARETTTQITLDLMAEYHRLIDALGDSLEGDCLLIGYQLPNLCIQVVNNCLGMHKLVGGGRRIVHSDKLQIIPRLLADAPDTFFEHENLYANTTISRATAQAKLLILSARYNRGKKTSSILHHFRPEKNVFAFYSDNVVNRAHTLHCPAWVRLTTYDEWLSPPQAGTGAGATARFRDIARRYAGFCQGYARDQLSAPLPENVALALEEHAASYLTHVAEAYRAISKRVARVRPKRLLTPTGGKTFIRALSMAVRKQGGRVTGFPHGHYICHYSSPRPALHELATVDEFMAYSPGSVPLMERNLGLNPPPRNNPVRITHENSDHLLNIWRTWEQKPLPQKIKTVMVVELSLMLEWAGYHAAENLVNYHFYYSLCRLLSDNGYKVIFKRRPKGLTWDGLNIFQDIPNVEIEYRPFETPGVIDRADAVIIQYAMSSTLYYSMCTNKTVIYADAGWEPWFPDVYQSMAKRCRVLKCWYDERNRACFDGGQLLKILEQEPEAPNTEFLERYLFPEQ